MKKTIAKRELLAVLFSVIGLILAIGVVLFFDKLELKVDSTIIIAILLFSLLIYLFASGKITELRGPGGLKMIIRQSTNLSIKRSELVSIITINVGPKFEIPDENVLRRSPTVLKAIKEDQPDICEGLKYVNEKLGTDSVRYVVIEDRMENFVGMVPIRDISENDELNAKVKCTAYKLFEWTNDPEKLKAVKGYVSSNNAGSIEWSRKKCLELMLEEEIHALPILEKNKLIGILERNRLVDSILMQLAKNLEN